MFNTADIGTPLPLSFYARPADLVAPELLGKILAVRENGELRAGRITEVEAYLGEADLACHASKGFTKRTSTLYGEPGSAYVYLIYGQHELFNAVCERVGEPHAVLVRAVELLKLSSSAAPNDALPSRGDGPGRLTRALGINRSHNGHLLNAPPVSVHDGQPPREVLVTPRVGVAYAAEWANAPLRYLDAGSSSVSRPAAGTVGGDGYQQS